MTHQSQFVARGNEAASEQSTEVRSRGTTKTCTYCLSSKEGDNNVWMVQLLLPGTNFVNIFGRLGTRLLTLAEIQCLYLRDGEL